MADVIAVICPVCGTRWEEDLDWHRENASIHALSAGAPLKAGRETFRFRCPQDGTWVTVTAPEDKTR